MMQDGIVTVEIESVQNSNLVPGRWQETTEIPGYTGISAFAWKTTGNLHDDPLVIDAPMTDEGYKLSYQIKVPESGEYMMRIRNFHLQSTGDNDAWVSINGSMLQRIWDGDTGKFTWSEAIADENDYQAFPLAAGINTIDIVGRSKNWLIDRFVIYQKDVPERDWSDIQRPESPIVTASLFDDEPPAIPVDFKAVTIGIATADLSWQVEKEDKDIYGYDIYNQMQKLGTSHKTSFLAYSLDEATTYTFTIKARDYAGNTTAAAAELRLKTQKFSASSGIKIHHTAKSVKIDGVAEQLWNSVAAETVRTQGEISGTYKLLWDDQNLYLWLHMIDDDVMPDHEIERGFDIFFDLDHNKTPYPSMDDRFYSLRLNSSTISEITNNAQNTAGIQEVRQVGDAQYMVEAAFPWLTLGAQPEPGKLLGLYVGAREYDTPDHTVDSRESWFAKTEDPVRKPSTFATARIEID
jgi:hypothetical protein